MGINELLISLMLTSQSLMGVIEMPENVSPWKVEKKWSRDQGQLELILSTRYGDLSCPQDSLLVFPQILYAEQEVYGKGIHRSLNAPHEPKNIFGQMSIKCSDLKSLEPNDTLQWRVQGYSRYFSHFSESPKIKPIEAHLKVSENLYIGSTLGLFLFSLLLYMAFAHKENLAFTLSLSLSAFFLALYFFWNVSGEFGLVLSMLSVHKMADLSLVFGFLMLMMGFYFRGFLHKKFLILFFAMCGIATLTIGLGGNGDIIQVGTSTPFIAAALCQFYICHSTLRLFVNKRDPVHLMEFFFALIFSTFVLLEMSIVMGTLHMPSYFPLGLIFAFLIFTVSINRQIRKTYKERDELLDEMGEKIKSRTADLSQALKEKDIAQAELIESARLASLGTLSAGIAHEINNSINYVNACVIGLEKQMNLAVSKDSPQLPIIKKLLKTIKHGAEITISIVSSLRSYTGLEQSEMQRTSFDDVVNSVTTIIRSKMGSIEFIKDYDPKVQIYGSVVGLSQVIMNLVTNALDALPHQEEGQIKEERIKEGRIKISAHTIENRKDSESNEHSENSESNKNNKDHFKIVISDNGSGMEPHLVKHIFDPFFTTKEVGKGTGLGLYIVKKEIESRHKGTITVESTKGEGTTFVIELPQPQSQRKPQAHKLLYKETA